MLMVLWLMPGGELWRPRLHNTIKGKFTNLFLIVHAADLKLQYQVVILFHEFGGNAGDDVPILLPKCVT
ncbi:hypothetical protein L1887_05960 [Cichorium endivia]|nr:hypothetical protein L1887_05960 [Cichorium endivia]